MRMKRCAIGRKRYPLGGTDICLFVLLNESNWSTLSHILNILKKAVKVSIRTWKMNMFRRFNTEKKYLRKISNDVNVFKTPAIVILKEGHAYSFETVGQFSKKASFAKSKCAECATRRFLLQRNSSSNAWTSPFFLFPPSLSLSLSLSLCLSGRQ